jgi:IS5 family transposase
MPEIRIARLTANRAMRTKFRHRSEEHELGRQVFATVNEHLDAQGFKVSTGTIVDS